MSEQENNTQTTATPSEFLPEKNEAKESNLSNEAKESNINNEAKESNLNNETKESNLNNETNKDEKKEKEVEKKKEDKSDKEDEDEDEEEEEDEEDEEKFNKAISEIKNDSLKAKLIQLKLLNDKRNSIAEKKEDKEKNNLSIKYEQKYKEVYEQIEDIALNKNTSYEISDADKKKYSISDNNDEEKEIINYWKTILINANFFSMNEKDKKILNNLIEVKYNPSTDSLDFTVEFIFNENDYFEPNILKKTYKMDKKGDLCAMDASKITWKSEDKNPTIKMKVKTIKKGKKQKKKHIKEKVDSFFNFFKSFEDKKKEVKNKDESNSSSDSEKSENDEDVEINDFEGEVSFFKDDLFKNQLEYYLNIIDMNNEEDEEEDDEDDESDNDSEEAPKGKKKGKVVGKRKKSENKKEKEEEKKADCKTQ